MRVALDAMGGDRAPGAAVEGALLALERDAELAIDLVGREEAILDILADRKHERLAVVHAPAVVTPGDSPVRAARENVPSSLHVALRRVRDGESDAVVSAGDTGAILAAAMVVLRRCRGVSRPGIAVPLPHPGGTTVLSDAGANLHPRPVHLMHYGLMAAELAKVHLETEEPRVGLLSVGTEAGKGTDLVRKVDGLLRRAPLNYVGLVEGQDLFGGTVDVVVSDGFTGNAVLKACEGFAGSLGRALGGSGASTSGAVDPASLDFSTYGGAPLLGVRGVVVIGHGRSGARAIASGVLAAVAGVRHELVQRVSEAVWSMSRLARAARFLPSREGGEGK
jgi:glycerol-3-phosphate acyltransferase PlsX